MSRVLLGDVAFERKETCKDNKEIYLSVGLEHLTPEELELYAWDENKENTFTKVFRKGDVLFGRRRAYLKKAAVAPFDGICSGDITVIQANHEHMIPELLPFIIQNDDLFDFAVEKSAGSLSPRVKWEHLKTYEFELPEKDKQRELAELLWSMEATKKSYKKLINATDELVKSQFIEMFGDAESNPMRWPEMTLKDVCIGKMSYGSGAAATDYDGCTRYVRITDITDTGVLSDDIKSPSTIDEKYLLHDGDILFARSGATVGKTLRFREKYGRCIYAGFLIRLVPDLTKVIPDYVFGFTKSAFYEKFVRDTQRAVGQPNINAQEYGDLKICVPPIEQQSKFSTFLEQSDKSKFELEKALDALKASYKSIIRDNLG